MNQPFLSVAIPTFNRKEKIINLLNVLKTQILNIPHKKIEIIVSDNCSSDGTYNALKDWKINNSDLHINVSSNLSNIGFDRNIHKVIELSSGDYVWTLGDDDEIKENALTEITSNLVNLDQSISFCFLNYATKIDNKILEPECKLRKNCITSGGDFFILSRFASSFVSSNIFKKSAWSAKNFENHFDTAWYHFYVQRDILEESKVLIIAKPFIYQNSENLQTLRDEKISESNGLDFFISAHIKFLDFVFTLKNYKYPNRTIKSAIKIAWTDNLRQIIFYKITRRKYKLKELVKILKQMKPYLGNKLSFWIAHLPLLFLPIFLVKILYKISSPIYKLLKSLNNY